MTKFLANRSSAVVAAFTVPWNAFVAAFLYYTVLTLVVIGMTNLSASFMVAAYLLPVVVYTGVIANRGLHALASVQVRIAETPQVQGLLF